MNSLHDIPKERIFIINTEMKIAICYLATMGYTHFTLREHKATTDNGAYLDVEGDDRDHMLARNVGIQYWTRPRPDTDISNFDSLDVRIEYE